MTTVSLIIPLHKSRRGQQFTIHALPAGKVRILFLRLGISEGEPAICAERLPGGTIVLKKKRQRIAVGYKLAKEILVRLEAA